MVAFIVWMFFACVFSIICVGLEVQCQGSPSATGVEASHDKMQRQCEMAVAVQCFENKEECQWSAVAMQCSARAVKAMRTPSDSYLPQLLNCLNYAVTPLKSTKQIVGDEKEFCSMPIPRFKSLMSVYGRASSRYPIAAEVFWVHCRPFALVSFAKFAGCCFKGWTPTQGGVQGHWPSNMVPSKDFDSHPEQVEYRHSAPWKANFSAVVDVWESGFGVHSQVGAEPLWGSA